MRLDNFESTLPFTEPAPGRLFALQGELGEATLPVEYLEAGVESTLSPSLLADLQRFASEDRTSDVLGVIAACVRHNKRVTVHLQCGRHELPLTVFPQERLIQCPTQMVEQMARNMGELRVLHVEPAWHMPPGTTETMLVGKNPLLHPLAPFLWELALRGPRRELLPEIAGNVAYRVAPGMDFTRLPVRGPLLASLTRLRNQTANLREFTVWLGQDRPRAERLLNALYLQAGLIVSRAHPEAVSDGWLGMLGL